MGNSRHIPSAHRSGLEDSLAAQLKAAGVAAEYEPFRIPFIPTRTRHYTPDFVLPNGIIIESKGYFVSADRAKHLTIKLQHPDLDIRFVFARPNQRIGKKSSTTYSMWAKAKGFRCAAQRIPPSWLVELPNSASLAAIAKLKEG
jgi:hypothetical protein